MCAANVAMVGVSDSSCPSDTRTPNSLRTCVFNPVRNRESKPRSVKVADRSIALASSPLSSALTATRRSAIRSRRPAPPDWDTCDGPGAGAVGDAGASTVAGGADPCRGTSTGQGWRLDPMALPFEWVCRERHAPAAFILIDRVPVDGHACLPELPESRQRRPERRQTLAGMAEGVDDGDAVRSPSCSIGMLEDSTTEGLARPDLKVDPARLLVKRQDRIREPDRPTDLVHPVARVGGLRVGQRSTGQRRDDRDRGRSPLDGGDDIAEVIEDRVHHLRVEGV